MGHAQTMTTTRILLKARPTAEQLRDRLAAPVPDGLELYLDPADLTGGGWLERLVATVEAAGAPTGFAWIVEAPIRTLGGQYFGLTRDDEDHRETLRRVATAGRAIGAVAANAHLVAPTLDLGKLTAPERQRALRESHAVVAAYQEYCDEAGLIPQLENVPPVGRMRESAFVVSPIGAAPEDLLALGEAFPRLRFCVDLSHAGLYLNWSNGKTHGLDELAAVAAFHGSPGVTSLETYLAPLVPRILSVHVSNAMGLLGEGLPYGDGDFDLDQALGSLSDAVPYWVTETLEPDPTRATGMRDAQSRLISLRERASAGSRR
ncbi:MAG TPA: hypothetical protein VIO35_00985 [Chloroflexota bacterium]